MKKEVCIDTVKQLREKYDRFEKTPFTATVTASTQAMRSERNLFHSEPQRNAHFYDNAHMESFFATLKKEKMKVVYQ